MYSLECGHGKWITQWMFYTSLFIVRIYIIIKLQFWISRVFFQFFFVRFLSNFMSNLEGRFNQWTDTLSFNTIHFQYSFWFNMIFNVIHCYLCLQRKLKWLNSANYNTTRAHFRNVPICPATEIISIKIHFNNPWLTKVIW